jgi:hypothetical protein
MGFFFPPPEERGDVRLNSHTQNSSRPTKAIVNMPTCRPLNPDDPKNEFIIRMIELGKRQSRALRRHDKAGQRHH